MLGTTNIKYQQKFMHLL